jgi:hypothetical protein
MNHSDRPQDPQQDWVGVVCVALGLPVEIVRLLERWLAGALDARGCDGTLTKARRWARYHQVDDERLAEGLLALGAHCDCAALDLVVWA